MRNLQVRRIAFAAGAAVLFAASAFAGPGRVAPVSAQTAPTAAFTLVSGSGIRTAGTVVVSRIATLTQVNVMLIGGRPGATYAVSLCSAATFPTGTCTTAASNDNQTSSATLAQIRTDRSGNVRALVNFFNAPAVDLVRVQNTSDATDFFFAGVTRSGESAMLATVPISAAALCDNSNGRSRTFFSC